MKSTFTVLPVFALCLKLGAQTIVSANFALALSQTANVVIANPSTFSMSLITTTGTGVTWNASALMQQAGTPTVHIITGAPSGTPYGPQYPAANYVQYDPALTALIPYEYILFNADSMVTVGSYPSGGAHEDFQDYDKRLVFPFSYGQSFTDSYAKTNYSSATTVSSYQTGTRTVSFNGYGTLILPQGSYTGVALITETRTNSLGPVTNAYTWYEVSTGKKLMFLENNGSTTIAFTTDSPTGIGEMQMEYPVTLFPDPVQSSATLNIACDQSLKNSRFTLLDIRAVQVRSIVFDGNTFDIDRGTLPQGIYFYSVITETGAVMKGKMIVQ